MNYLYDYTYEDDLCYFRIIYRLGPVNHVSLLIVVVVVVTEIVFIDVLFKLSVNVICIVYAYRHLLPLYLGLFIHSCIMCKNVEPLTEPVSVLTDVIEPLGLMI